MSTYAHTVTVHLALGARVTDNAGLPLFALGLFPQGGLSFHLPAALYAALGDAATWARAAWDVLAGPGWGADLGLMWEAILCL